MTTEVLSSIGRVDSAEWNRLESGQSLYQSYPWLSWAESNCSAGTSYVLARDTAGVLIGAVPAYRLSAAGGSWNTWYDPLAVFAGNDTTKDARRPRWLPLLLVGSLSGYHSDVLVDRSLGGAARRAVTRALLRRCRALAGAGQARSMAMMYAPGALAAAVAEDVAGATQPILTSANTRIRAAWPTVDAFLNSFPRRRRYNIRREIDLFRSGGSEVVECRLSDCVSDIGPLLGNVHRRHGADDSDADTARYLKSQAACLDDVSTVFLEIAGGEAVGFSLCYEWGRELHVRVVGFDYERSSRFAYFNLAYYLPLDHAIRRGLTHVHLGPGTYDAKAGRGAVLDPTWSVVWPPDDENRAWFERVRHPGPDAQEAARWLDAGRRHAP